MLTREKLAMKNSKKVIFLLLVILCNAFGYTQDFHINSKSEKIEVKNDSSFIREVTIQFSKSEELRLYPILFDTELEKVFNIKIYRKKKNRLKELALGKVIEENVELEYIASKSVKIVTIPENEDIYLKYSISCNELMYLSSLRFFSYETIDSLKYQITIPNTFDLAYKIIEKDSLDYFSIDSTKTFNSSIWNIKTTPKKVVHNPLQLFGIYKNLKVPLMQTLIVPSQHSKKPLEYMNNWYYQNLRLKRGLNYASKLKIDELTAGVHDKRELIKILYNYVQNNFKYVAIEIGMGAFIPSHANEVFANKQGDCKDLSNFLSEALNYKGVKSDIALAATFDHLSDCDFPSLSAANHVICVAYIDDKEILLDPTDPIHRQGTPIQSLQGRTVLVVNSNGGKPLEVKQFSPQQNNIIYQLYLTTDSDKMLLNGSFDVKYAGISDNFLQRAFKSLSKKEFESIIQPYFEQILGNQGISNLTTSNKQENLSFKGDLTISGKTFNDGLTKYLFPDFLPKLIETENRDSLLDGTNVKYPFQKKVIAQIKLDEQIENFEPKEFVYKEKGMSLLFKISYISDLEIQLEYDFIFDYIFINKENIDNTNKILQSFKKIINEPILLKKKKV